MPGDGQTVCGDCGRGAVGMTAAIHKWVRHQQALDYCRVGWMPLPSLDGTHHGEWSVHMIWLCRCPVVQPRSSAA